MFETRKIMTADPISVTPETPADKALEILVDKNITGLPVVDKDHKLIGIVSEKDLLSLLDQDRDGKVADFMTEQVTSFDVNADVIEICQSLIANDFRRVPITENGVLIGVISRRDLIKFIIEPIEPSE